MVGLFLNQKSRNKKYKVVIRAYFLENVWKPMATIYLVSLRVVTEGSKFKGHETYILRGDGD